MMWNGWGYGWGFGWLMPVFFFFLMIWVIIMVTRRITYGRWDHRRFRYRGDAALAIARERYAKGELSKDDFDRIRKDLED